MNRGQRSYDALEVTADAETVTCPQTTCQAPAGDPCINPLTGDPPPVPHWQRIKAAQEAP